MKTETKTFIDVTGSKVLVSQGITRLMLRLKEINKALNQCTDLTTMFKNIDKASAETEVVVLAREDKDYENNIIVNIRNEVYFIITYSYNLKTGLDLQKITNKPVFCLGIQNLE